MTTIETADLSTFTIACGASTDCRHAICAGCGEGMVRRNQKIKDHPGVVARNSKTVCTACRLRGVGLTEDDLADKTHELMSDEEIQRVKETDFAAWVWFMLRRVHRKEKLKNAARNKITE